MFKEFAEKTIHLLTTIKQEVRQQSLLMNEIRPGSSTVSTSAPKMQFGIKLPIGSYDELKELEDAMNQEERESLVMG